MAGSPAAARASLKAGSAGSLAAPSGTTVVTTSAQALQLVTKLRHLTEPGRWHAVHAAIRESSWDQKHTPYGHAEVLCVSVYCGADVDFGNGPCLWISAVDEDGGKSGFLEHFRDYFTDPAVKKVFHDYSLSYAALSNEGIQLRGFAGDTMHMARLEDSDREEAYSLECLGEDYLGELWLKQVCLEELMAEAEAGTCEELHCHASREVRSRWVERTSLDAIMIWELHMKLSDRLRSMAAIGQQTMLEFYHAYWMPFATVLVGIEERGLPMDVKHFQMQKKRAVADLKRETASFREWLRQAYAGKYPGQEMSVDGLNPGSPKQMSHLLFGTGVMAVGKISVGGLGLPTHLTRNTKSNKGLQVSREVIEAMVGDPAKKEFGTALPYLGQDGCLGLSHMLNMHSIRKALTAFISPLEKAHISQQGRVHSSLNLHTSTGRLTSSNPNLQQLPALDKDLYELRRGVACRAGRKFIVADYGQLELRVLAHLTGCKAMIDALKKGCDLHSSTAWHMYPHIQEAVAAGEVALEAPATGSGQVPLVKSVYAAERRAAKAVNFGIAYGLTFVGLAEQLGCSGEEGKDMISKWYAAYPEVKAWQNNTIRAAKKANGGPHVVSLRGRWRRIRGLLGDRGTVARARRQAINAPVQGGAADVVVEAMLRADACELLKEQLGFRIVLQIHDELIFEGPEENAAEALVVARDLMQHPFLDGSSLKVPLPVDAQVVDNWHEAKN